MKYRRIRIGIGNMLASALLSASPAIMPTAPATAAPFAYVANFCELGSLCPAAPASTVTVVDVATGATVATVSVGNASTPSGNIQPNLVAVTPDGMHAYVTCDCGSALPIPSDTPPFPGYHAPLVSVIDAATNAVTQVYGPSDALNFTDQGTFGLAVTPDGSRVYVATQSGPAPSGPFVPTIFVVDTATNTAIASIVDARLGTPFTVAITPDGTRAYVTMIHFQSKSSIPTRLHPLTTRS